MRRNQEAQLEEISERLRALDADDRVTGVVLLRDPNAQEAAAQYEGLRKQVVAAAQERRAHLAQLTQMAVTVQRATSLDDIRTMVKEWMVQAGVEELRTPPQGSAVLEVFEPIGGEPLPDGTPVEVVEPAYRDAATGQILRLGRIRAIDGAPSARGRKLDRTVEVADPPPGTDEAAAVVDGDAGASEEGGE